MRDEMIENEIIKDEDTGKLTGEERLTPGPGGVCVREALSELRVSETSDGHVDAGVIIPNASYGSIAM